MEILVTLLPPIYHYCLLSHPAWYRVQLSKIGEFMTKCNAYIGKTKCNVNKGVQCCAVEWCHPQSQTHECAA